MSTETPQSNNLFCTAHANRDVSPETTRGRRRGGPNSLSVSLPSGSFPFGSMNLERRNSHDSTSTSRDRFDLTRDITKAAQKGGLALTRKLKEARNKKGTADVLAENKPLVADDVLDEQRYQQNMNEWLLRAEHILVPKKDDTKAQTMYSLILFFVFSRIKV